MVNKTLSSTGGSIQPASENAGVAEITIEQATWRDLGPVRDLENICFPVDAWPLIDMIGVLMLPNIVRLKAMQGDKMVGFIAGDIKQDKKMAWIATIAVHPDHQGQGIGRRLLAACEELVGMPRIRLTVRLSNHPAIHLYETTGYQRVGIWPRYYRGKEDALLMEKQLDN